MIDETEMSRYCPYTDQNIVYTECAECEQKICLPGTFFCLVVGSKLFRDYKRLERALDNLLKLQTSTVIVSGGSVGTDRMAEEYAKNRSFPMIIFRASPELSGKAADREKAERMNRYISKQNRRGVVAFWNGESPGTKQSVDLAGVFHNDIRVITIS